MDRGLAVVFAGTPGFRGSVARRHRGVAPSHRRRLHAARPPERARAPPRGQPGQGARARAGTPGAAAGDAARAARPRARSRRSRRTSWWSSPTACCCRPRCSRCRASVASTSMPRCCRVGAARPRSRARSSPATTRTGVCIMRMEAGLDTGPVHAARALPRSARARPRASSRRGSRGRAAPRIVEALDALAAGRAEFVAAGSRRARPTPRSSPRPRRASTGARTPPRSRGACAR